MQILSGSLMSDIRIKERRKMVEKRLKMHDLYVCIVYLLYRYIYMYLVRVNQSCVCNRNSRVNLY